MGYAIERSKGRKAAAEPDSIQAEIALEPWLGELKTPAEFNDQAVGTALAGMFEVALNLGRSVIRGYSLKLKAAAAQQGSCAQQVTMPDEEVEVTGGPEWAGEKIAEPFHVRVRAG